MPDVVRFSVSLEADLLDRFDRYCESGRFSTRSEAIRQLLHKALTDASWSEGDREAVATLTLVYDHHRNGLLDQMTDVQHDHPELVVSSMHVHLDHHHCLEVIVLRGKGTALRDVAARLAGMKGVRCGDLVVAHAPESGGV